MNKTHKHTDTNIQKRRTYLHVQSDQVETTYTSVHEVLRNASKRIPYISGIGFKMFQRVFESRFVRMSLVLVLRKWHGTVHVREPLPSWLRRCRWGAVRRVILWSSSCGPLQWSKLNHMRDEHHLPKDKKHCFDLPRGWKKSKPSFKHPKVSFLGTANTVHSYSISRVKHMIRVEKHEWPTVTNMLCRPRRPDLIGSINPDLRVLSLGRLTVEGHLFSLSLSFSHGLDV